MADINYTVCLFYHEPVIFSRTIDIFEIISLI